MKPTLLFVLLALLSRAPCRAADEVDTARVRPWDATTLEQAESIAVQEGGRIKPLRTVADFMLLRLNGKRSHVIEAEEVSGTEKFWRRMRGQSTGLRMTPTEWLLDCLFFPEEAREQEVFLVNNWEVVAALGVDHTGKNKRDRYSYEELLPGRVKLQELAQQYHRIEEIDRDPVQNQIYYLHRNVVDFEYMIHFLDFAHGGYAVQASSGLAALFEGAGQDRASVILTHTPELFDMVRGMNEDGLDAAQRQAESTAFQNLLLDLEDRIGASRALALIPPVEPAEAEPEWMTPADFAARCVQGGVKPPSEQVALVASLENLVALRDDPASFRAEFANLAALNRSMAEARGEYGMVPLEVSFYRSQHLFISQIVFVLSFLLVAVSWLAPRVRWLRYAVPLTVLVALGYLTSGIVVRCIIRSRPPVSTLYETVLFITACAVLVGLITESINRRRVAVAIASVIGCIGMFLANKYEVMKGEDTMPSLVAVLDTNFWLSTHVTTVTIGYAAGLLAAVIAHVYLLGKLLGFRSGDHDFYKGVARMVYGAICFGLLFSVVGTILGGIWANDSWGRFWGWDPKENGALMIVLWELVMLHARMGGYIKDHGFSMAAVIGGVIVAFSWWGVNLMGVGLHSYGFTAGVKRGLMLFYCIEAGVFVLGFIAWVLALSSRTPSKAATAPPAP